VASKSFGPTADIKFGPGRVKEVGKDISVVTLYQYLSSVGTSDPGRVKEVGFFTHSFPGGPILFDTNDDDRSPARVGSDFDGRMKDFNSTNAARWPNMKAAMAVDGRWQIWGCSATVHHKNVTTAAHRHKKDGDSVFFTVTTLAKHHDGRKAQSIEERTTRAGVRVDMDARFRAQTYMAGAAEVLGRSTGRRGQLRSAIAERQPGSQCHVHQRGRDSGGICLLQGRIFAAVRPYEYPLRQGVCRLPVIRIAAHSIRSAVLLGAILFLDRFRQW
jgi:hypothetical protein